MADNSSTLFHRGRSSCLRRARHTLRRRVLEDGKRSMRVVVSCLLEHRKRPRCALGLGRRDRLGRSVGRRLVKHGKRRRRWHLRASCASLCHRRLAQD
eukprot:418150-Pleurochrysis_carterae.AAC.2